MQIRFDGQTILVAGAARGIGKAIAEAFARDGGTVFAADLLAEDVRLYAEAFNQAPASSGQGHIEALALDVTDKASLSARVADIVRQQGRLDCLVYVAGGVRGQSPKPIEEVAAGDFAAIVDANLTGAFLAAQSVVPVMKQAGKGRIVVIASRAGLAPSLTGIQSYAAAKHAQVGLVKQLAQELGQFGITVNAVAPGFMATSPDYVRQWNSYSEDTRANFTKTIAVRRMGQPEDIADATLFLASDRASFITGQTLPVTGSPL
jgi:3-oxoacyl-[acyl-carrier protein] reductase